ncbi:DUF6890 family protein [Mannheimia haemolytica]
MERRVESLEKNGLSQAYALRRHYLPNEDDSEQNLARAIWLNKNYFESLANAVASGISKVL